jgi:hypothetical protein
MQGENSFFATGKVCAAFRPQRGAGQGSLTMLRTPNRRRDKVFKNHESRVPLDREAKVRIMHLARVLMRRTEKGKHYGILTGKFVAVLHAMLWLIHNSGSGQCNPAYETIADKAACARSTVYEAIKRLEEAGLLSWVNRLSRVQERATDLFGHTIWAPRVIRTSNAYTFRDPKAPASRGKSSKSEFPPGLMDEVKTTSVDNLLAAPSTEMVALGRALASYSKTAGFTV